MKKLAILTVVALFMAGSAQATIGISTGNVSWTGLGIDPAQTAGVVPQTNWNNLDNNMGLYEPDGEGGWQAMDPDVYVDSDGNNTSLDLTFSIGGNDGIGSDTSDGDHAMLSEGFQAGSGPEDTGTFTLTTVPYATYDVIVYMGRSGKTPSSVQWVSADDGTSKTYIMSADEYLEDGSGNITFVESTATSSGDATTEANYVTMSGLSGDVTITFSNGGDPWDANVSGLQIVEAIDALDGDYNDDAFVGQGDLDLVLLNWGDTGGAPEGWVNDQPAAGDLIGQGYLDKVLLNWGEGTAPTSSVPEPLTMTLLGLGGLGVLARRRRRS